LYIKATTQIGWQAEVLLQLLRHGAILHRRQRQASRRYPSGAHGVRLRRGGGLGKGGGVTLYVDGKPVGTGRVEQTEIMVFSADETCDIGNETGSPVTKDYTTRKFTGDVNWVEIDVSDAARI
jgi:hypothetical protein